jgi:hypothetical protein
MASISYFRNLWLKVGDKRIGHRTILRPFAVILMTAPLPPVLNRPWLTRRLHYAPPIGRHRSSLLTPRRSLVELGPMFDAPSHGPALRPLGCKSDKASAVGAPRRPYCLDRACQLLSVPRLCADFPLLEANRHRDPMRP